TAMKPNNQGYGFSVTITGSNTSSHGSIRY
ncbi:MAG: hypothetical protein ACJARN_000885, partial [Arenicella sp.]